jgi:hypothetical protein
MGGLQVTPHLLNLPTTVTLQLLLCNFYPDSDGFDPSRELPPIDGGSLTF